MSATIRSVDVPGGALAVELHAGSPGSAEPVLAVHGISSHRKLWNWLLAEAPDLGLVAPDLRGRGDSVDVAGPSSVAVHAQDLVAVLDALELDAVHVLGMSMGGFVAVELAAEHPSRVKSLVLIDGGPPMTPPAGLTEDNVEGAFADRLARLDRSWSSVAELAEFFTATTAPLLDPADPLLLDYLAHDLRDGRVRLAAAAVGPDARSVFFGPDRLAEVRAPMRFAHAQWSVGAASAPAYPQEVVDGLRERCVSVRAVPGVDHAGSIMTKAGAVVAAELVTEALA